MIETKREKHVSVLKSDFMPNLYYTVKVSRKQDEVIVTRRILGEIQFAKRNDTQK